jgi:hypothetical protein
MSTLAQDLLAYCTYNFDMMVTTIQYLTELMVLLLLLPDGHKIHNMNTHTALALDVKLLLSRLPIVMCAS